MNVPSNEIEICQQEATLLKSLQEAGSCNEAGAILGVRVVYNCSKSDHAHMHNEHWTEALSDESECRESGTITDFGFKQRATVTVLWDCGTEMTYTHNLWSNITVFTLGPAGYLGQMVFCDKCLDPSKGLAFRLARDNTRVGDLYDLCVYCYNERDDEHTASQFYCNMPSGNIDQEQPLVKVPLPTRKESKKYKVFGLHKKATVQARNEDQLATDEGVILNIVHEKGNYDLRKAKYYDSCAEVKLKDGSLVYWEAGSGGKVELIAVKPGAAPHTVPIEHYLNLGDDFVKETFTYKTKLVEIQGKEQQQTCYCFKRFKPDKTCYSLTISGTTLTEITDPKVWQNCKDLEIIILLMNELIKLPRQLEEYAISIRLVCLQNNRFQSVPDTIFKLTNIKHLNLHGNEISEFPSQLKLLIHLERLKFGHNKLYSLPDIFGAFKKLIEITFNRNFLTRLPPSFAELEKLESIDLTNNSFTCIPSQLLKLLRLKSIYMRYNRIHRLSPLDDEEGKDTLELIEHLVTIRLRGNPIFEQLQTFLKSEEPTLEDIKANFAELDQKPGPVPKPLRVLLLGSCGAGKTSILETLSYSKYVTPTSEMRHDHTVGINRFSIPVKTKTKDGRDIVVELRLWDFAGERSYVMMNKLFVTDDTLICIAVNFATYKSSHFQQHIASWIEQIITKIATPIVWVVGTHADKCTLEDIERIQQSIRERIERECKVYEQKLSAELVNLSKENSQSSDRSPSCMQNMKRYLEQRQASNVPCFVKNKLEVICLSNTHGAKGFEGLRKHIDSLLCERNDTLSTAQQKATDKLRHKAEEFLSSGKAPIVNKEEIVNIVPELNDKEAERLLTYLYQVGAVLVYEAKVILDVDWLINLLKQIFHHDFPAMVRSKKKSNQISFHCLTENDIDQAIELQQTTGTVEDRLLNALWMLENETKEQLIKFLEYIGLVYKITEPVKYLFPWLAMTKNSNSALQISSENNIRILISYYFLPCIPPCLIQELVVRCQKGLRGHIQQEVYENSFLIKTNESFLVSALVKREPDNLCGNVYLLFKPKGTIDASMIDSTLWPIACEILKTMEAMLCSWTFYGHVIRRIHCPSCCSMKHYRCLQLTSVPQPQGKFHCKKCDDFPPSNLVTVPECLLLKKGEYFDAESSCSPVQPTQPGADSSHTFIPPPPLPSVPPHYSLNSPPPYEEATNLRSTSNTDTDTT